MRCSPDTCPGRRDSFLWVSEWGVIQSTDLARSEEILTGALPSVGNGLAVIETTWRGGLQGHLWSSSSRRWKPRRLRRGRWTGA